MDQFGIDRNRTYTREEICRRYGYDPESLPDKTPDQKEVKRSEHRNRDRFFRDNFLKKGLKAWPVGKSYEVSGEIYHAWTTLNSRSCGNDEIQTG